MEISSEYDLIIKVKEGNMNAFRILVDKYKRTVYSLCYQLTRNHADADDLSQETFIRAHDALKKFRMQSSFSTWIRRIAYNNTLNYLKKKKRLREEYPEQLEVSVKDDPSTDLEKNELSGKLDEALSSLPIEQKAAVELVIQEGLSYKEAAGIQGCPEGTVFWRIYQARRSLKEKMEPYITYYEREFKKTGGGQNEMR